MYQLEGSLHDSVQRFKLMAPVSVLSLHNEVHLARAVVQEIALSFENMRAFGAADLAGNTPSNATPVGTNDMVTIGVGRQLLDAIDKLSKVVDRALSMEERKAVPQGMVAQLAETLQQTIEEASFNGDVREHLQGKVQELFQGLLSSIHRKDIILSPSEQVAAMDGLIQRVEYDPEIDDEEAKYGMPEGEDADPIDFSNGLPDLPDYADIQEPITHAPQGIPQDTL